MTKTLLRVLEPPKKTETSYRGATFSALADSFHRAQQCGSHSRACTYTKAEEVHACEGLPLLSSSIVIHYSSLQQR